MYVLSDYSINRWNSCSPSLMLLNVASDITFASAPMSSFNAMCVSFTFIVNIQSFLSVFCHYIHIKLIRVTLIHCMNFALLVLTLLCIVVLFATVVTYFTICGTSSGSMLRATSITTYLRREPCSSS